MFVKIRQQLLQLNPLQMAILTLWALIMVSLPIADWSNGWSAMIGAITAGALATAVLVLALLLKAWGAAAALQAGVLIIIISWGFEVIGSSTGIPFGGYTYTDLLGPKILDVPIQIPLGWLMMLPPSWAVAQVLSRRVNSRWQFPAFVGLSALAMTAWDLFLDPMMVTWGVWVWDYPGSYFSVPWSNFFGWLLVSALITIIIRPGKLPLAPLLIIYTAVWLLKSSGLGFFWGIHGAAVAGGILMGIITSMAWRELIRGD